MRLAGTELFSHLSCVTSRRFDILEYYVSTHKAVALPIITLSQPLLPSFLMKSYPIRHFRGNPKTRKVNLVARVRRHGLAEFTQITVERHVNGDKQANMGSEPSALFLFLLSSHRQRGRIVR